MRTRLCSIAAFIAAAAGAAIWVAPIAVAQTGDEPSCSNTGSETECQSPGNVQINDSPAVLDPEPQYPYWDGYPYWGGDSVLGGPDDRGSPVGGEPGHR
jgi:hypothetical protein